MSTTEPNGTRGPLPAVPDVAVVLPTQRTNGPEIDAHAPTTPVPAELYQPAVASVGPNVTINNTQSGLVGPIYGARKKAWTVFWIDAFFGFLGFHRFYLGHYGMGLLYLFTGGLFGIGAIVDLFIAWKITRKENTRRGWGPVTK